MTAGLVVGADGYRSRLRRLVNPEAPYATYAGYMLWRGLVGERAMATATRWPADHRGFGTIDPHGYRLIAYPVPGSDGSLRPGERQISFAWYDIHRDALLRRHGCLSPRGEVLSTLTGDQISDDLRADLLEKSRRVWPEPWRQAVEIAIRDRSLFATPICEYLPPRLHRGRIVLAGDAAHVVSPMTGRGFATALGDADQLAGSIAACASKVDAVAAALDDYEARRLPAARELVGASTAWSRQYVSEARRRIHAG